MNVISGTFGDDGGTSGFLYQTNLGNLDEPDGFDKAARTPLRDAPFSLSRYC